MERRRSLFVVVALAASMGPLWSAILGRILPMLPFLAMSVLVAAIAFLYWKNPASHARRLALLVVIPVNMLAQFAGAGTLNTLLARSSYDERFMELERRAFGWVFADGQIVNWLDTSVYFGPHTLVGRVLTEVFQLAYLSFYWWTYLLILMLALKALRGAEGDWQNLERVICATQIPYAINIVCYVLVPVIGPFFHHSDRFVNPIEGFGVTGVILDSIYRARPMIEDCFPSGHVMLSWVTAICALKVMPRYGRLALPAAVLITAATLYLRYHYLTDVLAAIPLILLGLYSAGFLKMSWLVGQSGRQSIDRSYSAGRGHVEDMPVT